MSAARNEAMEKLQEIVAKLDALAAAVEGLKSAPKAAGGPPGTVFPPYGRAKGMPIAGADRATLEYYKAGCERSLADPSKERWHVKERMLLDSINAELAKHEEPQEAAPF